MKIITRYVLMVFFVFLTACSPEYDWRSVNIADGHITAVFPAKPVSQTREVVLDNEKLPFTMEIASVGNRVFAVGYSILPADLAPDPARLEKKGRALMASVYHTMGEAMPEPAPAFGEIIRFTKGANGSDFNVHVKILAANGLVAQVYVALNDPVAEEQVRQFLDGVKIQ
ncbi:MAG: hypothetical protein GX070_05135 [Alcaligenaceae bacterium]|nr:hypothetical protein [Alcaligenaceae bacterium]